MVGNGAPAMPLAASSNMTMKMSNISATSQKSSEMTITPPVSNPDTIQSMRMKSHPAQSKQSQYATTTISTTPTSTSGQLMADVRDRIRSREKSFNMQRIQMAEQINNECKLRTVLEVRVTALQDELASIRISNEALEAECTSLHGQIDETTQRLEAQSMDFAQRDRAMLEKVRDLETKLEEAADILKNHETEVKEIEDAIRVAVGELDDAKLTISNMETSRISHERDVQKRLTLKGTEAKKLKQEIKTLQAACADAISKKEAAEKEIHTQVKESMAESRKLRENLYQLQNTIEPFSQVVVIGVDVSGSVTSVIHEIKQAYRDILHVVKANNSNARVSVVIHGSHDPHDPSPVQAITDATFGIVDSIGNVGDSEDYSYCLEQASKILSMYVGSKKLVMLIGDGNFICSNTSALYETCEQLRSADILAHSVIIPSSSRFGSTHDSMIQEVSKITGGRIEYKDTYLAALDELLRHEREQHFKASRP